MCKSVNPIQQAPAPIQMDALEIKEHHESNLYGLFNLEASKESAVTRNGKTTDSLGFHWSNWTAVKDTNQKEEVATLTKKVLEDQVSLHIGSLEQLVQQQISP